MTDPDDSTPTESDPARAGGQDDSPADEVADAEALLSVVTAADVAHRIAALHERFGSFPVRNQRRENDASRFADAVARASDGWRGDAGAFVTDLDGRVLLVEHADAPDTWGTPGGGHEPGESFVTTARRELGEETGLDPAIVGVYEAVRTTIVHADDPSRTITMLTVHFEGVVGASEPALDVGDDEILTARWIEEPPDSLHEHCDAWVRETLGAFDTALEHAARRTTTHVDATIENLQAEHGDVPVRTDRLYGDADAFEEWVSAARADERVGGAYALVVRHGDDAPPVSPSMPSQYDYDETRALLVMGRAEDEWTVPGGGVEPGERFDAAVEREVQEETGVECEVTGVHEIVRGVGVREADGLELAFVYVVFDARYRQGAIELQSGELNGACWFREPPESEHWLAESVLEDWAHVFDAVEPGSQEPAREPAAPDGDGDDDDA